MQDDVQPELVYHASKHEQGTLLRGSRVWSLFSALEQTAEGAQPFWAQQSPTLQEEGCYSILCIYSNAGLARAFP